MRIPILVSMDENYIPRLQVLATSLYVNHPGTGFAIFLLHSRIPAETLEALAGDLDRLDMTLYPVKVDETVFTDARITDRYPKEMYYRLLAAQWLPEQLDRILYLDPDILVINQLYDLWNLNLDGYLFAAASHTGKTEMANNVNRLRLGTENNYFNSGVLLINLKQARQEIVPEEIFRYVAENNMELLLPDQDVLNALYGHRILEVDDSIWNYDARNFSNYMMRSGGEKNANWVMKHTAILHFCGREKPWKNHYRRRFGTLYRHYMSLTERCMGKRE